MNFQYFRRLALAAVAAVAMASFSNRAEAQLSKLSAYLPGDTNAILAIDVNALENTEMAKEEKWKEQRLAVREKTGTTAYDRELILTGAQVKPMYLESAWELSLFQLDAAPNMTDFADQLGSNLDNIDGHQAIETSGESYFVRLDEKLVGLMHPADRQKVARWLRDEKSYQLTPYLKDAIDRVTDRTPIVVALELKDITTPATVRVNIADHEAFEKRQKQVDEIANIIASVQGMSFEVQVAKNAAATLRIDFDQPAGPLNDFKDLMIDLLADMGISIPEFRDWNASTSGKTWRLQGKLTRQTIDRVFAMADTQFEAKVKGTGNYPGGKPPEDEASKQAQLALNYFRDVEDIVAKVGDYKGANATMYARWFRQRADDLENLPTLGVDPELVDFSLNVAKGLRLTAGTLRQTSSRKLVQQTSVNLTGGGSYGAFYGGSSWNGWGGYGYYRDGGGYDPNAEAADRARKGTQKRLVGIETRSQAATATFNTLDAIAEELAKLRISLTEKYKVQF